LKNLRKKKKRQFNFAFFNFQYPINNRFVNERVEQARNIADYLHGMQDGGKTTSKNIIRILYNQEKIAQKKKEQTVTK